MPILPCQTQSHISCIDRPTGRPQSSLPSLFVAMLLVAAAVTMANAQKESAQTLAERSAIVVRGRVLKVNASDEPMVAASRTPSEVKFSFSNLRNGVLSESRHGFRASNRSRMRSTSAQDNDRMAACPLGTR